MCHMELSFVNIYKYTCRRALTLTHHPGSVSQRTVSAVSAEQHGSPHSRPAALCSRYLLVGRKEHASAHPDIIIGFR